MNNSSWGSNRFRAISIVAVVAFGIGAFSGVTGAHNMQSVQPKSAAPQAKQLPDGGSDEQVEALAKQTFERLKKFDGKWMGRSTKGWQEVINF